MGQEKKIKKIILDMIINVVASFIPVFLLQLLIHPMLAKHISQEQYGDMITTISVIMVISGSLGNVLNNVRLLLNDIYENEKKSYPCLLTCIVVSCCFYNPCWMWL